MPNIRELPNKPLIEAILELRWQVSPETGDPHYPLFPGKLHGAVASSYPFHEALPASLVPNAMSHDLVQHRFRSAENSWPLIQVGPGIVTLNDTESYSWSDFGPRAKSLVKKVFEVYPQPADIKATSLLLRYLDAVDFDYHENDILPFLNDKLKVQVNVPSVLFSQAPVSERPESLNFRVSFPILDPQGVISLHFRTGARNGTPSLMWETSVRSAGVEMPEMPGKFDDWIEAAHRLTDDWFFKLIEGDLEKRFANE